LATLEGDIVRDISRSSATGSTRGSEKTVAEEQGLLKVIPASSAWTNSPYYYYTLMAFWRRRGGAARRRGPPRLLPARHHMELNRIMSPVVWLGLARLGPRACRCSGTTASPQREAINMTLFEMPSGHACTALPSGRRRVRDIPSGFEASWRQFWGRCRGAQTLRATGAVGEEPDRLARLRGTCTLDQQTRLDLGVTGPRERPRPPLGHPQASPLLEL